MKNNKFLIYLIILNFILILIIMKTVYFPNSNQSIKNFYQLTSNSLISPHSLREDIAYNKSNYLIVDTREKKDYLMGHIIGAVNIIPSDNLIVDFQNLQNNNPNKQIVIYCYTAVCLRAKKIGLKLANQNLFVRELGIGFNEWKNFWQEWNYEKEWTSIKIENYIQIGEEPGIFNQAKNNNLDSCNPESEFSC